MKKFYIILFISLAINIFLASFLLGSIYKNRPPPPPMIEFNPKQMHLIKEYLSESGNKIISSHMQNLRPVLRGKFKQLKQIKTKINNLINQQDLDIEIVKKEMFKMHMIQGEIHKEINKALLEAIVELSFEDRKALALVWQIQKPPHRRD